MESAGGWRAAKPAGGPGRPSHGEGLIHTATVGKTAP
jgi:hypothetical protein